VENKGEVDGAYKWDSSYKVPFYGRVVLEDVNVHTKETGYKGERKEDKGHPG
jgi:hypothetical protein